MSKKYIGQIISQNFVYPNNSVPEYDVELVQDINDNSVTGSVNSFTVTFSSSSNITISMDYTWNLNGAEKFVRASNRMSILSVHAMSPSQQYYKPFRTVYEISITDLSATTLTQTVSFVLIPSDLGLSAFTEGTYNFEVRFIGHLSVYPICLTVPVTFTPVPTPTPTPTPGADCYEYTVANLGGSTRTVTYTPCEGTQTTINVPGGDSVSLGCVREGTIFGNVTIIQGELCGLPPTSTPTSTPTATPTPTSTPPGPTVTPTPTPTTTPIPYSCYNITVVETFTSTNIQYTPCGGSPTSTFLGSGVTNYNLGCVQEGSYSGAASFSIGAYCGGTGPTPTPTATPTATPPPAPGECYSYTYGPAQAGCTINWTNCDGSPGSTFVAQGGFHSITCARVGSLSGCGQFVAGTLCGSFTPSTPTPTPTPPGPTSTPTSTPTATPTSTPTATPIVYSYIFTNAPSPDPIDFCTFTDPMSITYYSYSSSLGINSVLYTTNSMSTTVNGFNQYRMSKDTFKIWQINGSGVITTEYVCPTPTPTPTNSPTATPTSTPLPTIYTHFFTGPYNTVGEACFQTFSSIGLRSFDAVLVVGSVIYLDSSMTFTLNGENRYRKVSEIGKTFRINGSGVITEEHICAAPTATPTPTPTSTPVPPTATPTPTPTSSPSVTYEQIFYKWQDPCGVPYNNLYLGSDGLYYLFITSYELFNGDTYENPVPSQDVFNWYDWTTKSYVNGVQQGEFITLSPCTNF